MLEELARKQRRICRVVAGSYHPQVLDVATGSGESEDQLICVLRQDDVQGRPVLARIVKQVRDRCVRGHGFDVRLAGEGDCVGSGDALNPLHAGHQEDSEVAHRPAVRGEDSLFIPGRLRRPESPRLPDEVDINRGRGVIGDRRKIGADQRRERGGGRRLRGRRRKREGACERGDRANDRKPFAQTASLRDTRLSCGLERGALRGRRVARHQ